MRRTASVAKQLRLGVRLREQAAKQRIQFIEADLGTAMTLVRLADTAVSFAHVDHSNTILSKARHASETVARFLNEVDDASERRRLGKKHRILADAIEKVEQRKQRHAPSSKD